MNTTDSGRKAEDVVAQWLHKNRKHSILYKNWRTRWCEIDIVSFTGNVVYFTEVKYRSNQDWGSGFEYITGKKLKQMRFAAEFWMAEQRWMGDAQLCAAEVDHNFAVTIVDL